METILRYFTDFTEKQLEQFRMLEPLYKEWNEKINVISRKDIDSLYEKHILHSLAIAAAFEFPGESQVADLGTGGGFPGIPLAIFFPQVRFHLVDSIGKKLKVVEAVAAEAGLTNITVQHARLEEIRNRKFDYVVSRAVAPLKDLWRWSKPVLKTKPLLPEAPQPGLICLKGGDLAEEIQESGTRPRLMPLTAIFQEEFFKEKYLVYVQK
jgi:16S rRNA (guanine527-N7)-methyltransferase